MDNVILLFDNHICKSSIGASSLTQALFGYIKKIKCPSCSGDGSVSFWIDGEKEVDTCGRCGGIGSIIVNSDNKCSGCFNHNKTCSTNSWYCCEKCPAKAPFIPNTSQNGCCGLPQDHMGRKGDDTCIRCRKKCPSLLDQRERDKWEKSQEYDELRVKLMVDLFEKFQNKETGMFEERLKQADTIENSLPTWVEKAFKLIRKTAARVEREDTIKKVKLEIKMGILQGKSIATIVNNLKGQS